MRRFRSYFYIVSMFGLHFVVFGFAVFTIQASRLPSYIIPCHRDDPNLDACALRNGDAAIPHLVKGEKSLKLPSLIPLEIPEIVLQATSQLTIKLKNVKVSGLENSKIKDMKIDFKSLRMGGILNIPTLDINAEYEMDGRLLVIPLKGSGPAKVACENLDVHYTVNYTLIKKNGKDYIAQDFISKVSYTVGKINFKFDNLFNGDKNLGDRTNEFLNEHSNEIGDDFSVSITETVKFLITNLLKNFVAIVPFDEIFLP